MVIYETINLINGMRYIGKDSKNIPEYLGSGLLLNRAIEKHGIANFTKAILEECETIEELNAREIHWIKITGAVKSKMYYNIAAGGAGGDCISGLSPEKYKQFQDKQSTLKSGKKNPMYGIPRTPGEKEHLRRCNTGEQNGMYGKTHSVATKKLQKEKSVGRYTLPWFIKRYGVDGQSRYDKRNAVLSGNRRGSDNPSYRHVNRRELESIIKDTDCNLKDLCLHFQVGSTSMYGKFREYWGCSNLPAVRSVLCS